MHDGVKVCEQAVREPVAVQKIGEVDATVCPLCVRVCEEAAVGQFPSERIVDVDDEALRFARRGLRDVGGEAVDG